MKHSSEKEYYCKECKETFKGPSFFKHLKSDKHYANYINSMDRSDFVCDTASELNRNHTSQSTIPSDTRSPKDGEHATNFLRSVPQFLGMWYTSFSYDVTNSGNDLRVSIHVSKDNHK